jgi:DNA-binding CsgD family transcriptional regulator
VLPGPGFVVVTDRNSQRLIAVTLVLPTSPGWKPTVADRALLEHLAPHLVIARRMHLRLRQRRREAEALAAAFDRLALGVVIVNNRQRVSYSNHSAAELLGGPRGFTHFATLAAEAPDERSLRFQRLQPETERGEFVATHPENGHALHVLATGLRWGGRWTEAARFARAFFFGDPRMGSGTPLRVLRETFDLTPGQGRLAVLLMTGHSVEQAAGMLEISVHTARSVLKQTFEKTGTNRQGALVHLLLSTFGQVLAPGEPEPPRRAPRRAGRPAGGA